MEERNYKHTRSVSKHSCKNKTDMIYSKNEDVVWTSYQRGNMMKKTIFINVLLPLLAVVISYYDMAMSAELSANLSAIFFYGYMVVAIKVAALLIQAILIYILIVFGRSGGKLAVGLKLFSCIIMPIIVWLCGFIQFELTQLLLVWFVLLITLCKQATSLQWNAKEKV